MSYLLGSVLPMEEALAVLEQALDRCLSEPLWARTSQQVLAYFDRLQVHKRRVAAMESGLLRELEALGMPARQGASSTVAWLRGRYRVSGGEAKRMVVLAQALDDRLPVLSQALAAGTVNAEQARVIADAVTAVPGEVRGKAEEHLVGEAARFGPHDLGRLGERILEHVAPELVEAREETALARAEELACEGREFHVTDVAGSARVRVHGWLDREGAAHLRAALDPLGAPRPSKDGPDPRKAPQRLADALVEVCRLANACGELPESGGDRPQVVVTMDFDQLRARRGAGTLDDGGQLGPDAVRRLACDADVLPVVLGGAGQVLDVGRERRLITGAMRRALVVRDKGCAFPLCGRPPRWCHGHHVRHWVDGGESSVDSAVLLCGFHHRLIHRGEWEVWIVNRFPVFVPPSYVDEKREPIPGGYHLRQ